MYRVKYSTTVLPEEVRWFFLGNYNFPKIQRGSNIFLGGGGVQLFPGGGAGPNANFHRNLSKLGFSSQGVSLSPLWIRACSVFTCSSDPSIDLHMLFVSKLGGTGQSFLKPHQCHSVVSLSKTHLSFNPGRPVPT